MEKQKHLSLRISAALLRKFRKFCEIEKRSANAQLLYLIRKCIEEYEKDHGELKG